MPSTIDQRAAIADVLTQFANADLPTAAKALFAVLGYESDRTLPISTVKDFREQFDPNDKLTDGEVKALDELQLLTLLFQLTDSELTSQASLFEDTTSVEATSIYSYLFFAVSLPAGHYTRTKLSKLVRAINKPLPMPALVLFQHGETISVGIIHRRLSKRDTSKDVLEKVTLIKDIAYNDPIRAHLDILNDFILANLDSDFGVSNFVDLHKAWQERLKTEALSKNFYREIADWYFWAHHLIKDGTIRLPHDCDREQEQSLFLIRLLTRVIFCWFLVEKRLIPARLFREYQLVGLLKIF